MPVERSAGIIFFRKRGKELEYLVIRSSRQDSSRPEHWDFPKGLLEKGEDGLTAARREAEEEAGVRDFEIIPGFKETVSYFTRREGKSIPKFAAMFLAEAGDEEVRLSWEHDRYEWLSYEKAKKRLSNGAMKNALQKAHEFISRKGIPR